jgi:hypothetical protein
MPIGPIIVMIIMSFVAYGVFKGWTQRLILALPLMSSLDYFVRPVLWVFAIGVLILDVLFLLAWLTGSLQWVA